MSIKFQRFEAPPEGQTLLLGRNVVWKDPTKPEGKPREQLESEKGIPLPSWTQLFTVSGAVTCIALLNHLRALGRF